MLSNKKLTKVLRHLINTGTLDHTDKLLCENIAKGICMKYHVRRKRAQRNVLERITLTLLIWQKKQKLKDLLKDKESIIVDTPTRRPGTRHFSMQTSGRQVIPHIPGKQDNLTKHN